MIAAATVPFEVIFWKEVLASILLMTAGSP